MLQLKHLIIVKSRRINSNGYVGMKDRLVQLVKKSDNGKTGERLH